MQASSESVQAEVLRLLDLSGATCAVDVGGGNGALLCALAQANPHLKGVVYDLPHSRVSETSAKRGSGRDFDAWAREAFWGPRLVDFGLGVHQFRRSSALCCDGS
jgi:hypothetical protein